MDRANILYSYIVNNAYVERVYFTPVLEKIKKEKYDKDFSIQLLKTTISKAAKKYVEENFSKKVIYLTIFTISIIEEVAKKIFYEYVLV